MKHVLIMVFIITDLLLAGCRKINHETDVSGTVYDVTTLTVISQAHVYLLKVNGNCFTCNSVPFADTYTDANGNFSFNYKADKGYSYSLGATATNYFDELDATIYVDNFKNNKNNKILLKPQAYLKVLVKDIAPVDSFSTLNLSPYGEYSGQWRDGSGIFYNGKYGGTIDTFTVSRVFGSAINEVYYSITNNATGAVIYSLRKSLYCNAFDTTTYTINY